jgi:hypothetical protein
MATRHPGRRRSLVQGRAAILWSRQKDGGAGDEESMWVFFDEPYEAAEHAPNGNGTRL